jgi:hypothetical protein
MAEGRLAHADSRARDGEAEGGHLRSQLASALDSLRALSDERDGLAGELRAVSEDLEALVRENQVRSEKCGCDLCVTLCNVNALRTGSTYRFRYAMSRACMQVVIVCSQQSDLWQWVLCQPDLDLDVIFAALPAGCEQ